MSSKEFLAIDLGAESGRGVLGSFDGNRVTFSEVGRFATGANAVAHPDGTVRWDIDGIFREVEGIVDKAVAAQTVDGIGIDSWGVDFGLIDKSNALIAPPVCYRDRSHGEARDRMLTRIAAVDIWDATGIQGMPFNTLYQVAAIAARSPEQLDMADRLLLIPDLIAHRLSAGAHRSVEVTNGSTTQMMTPGGSAWNIDLLTRAGLPFHFLSPTVTSSTRIGDVNLPLSSGRGLGGRSVPIYAPGTHDTASAVAAVPVAGDKSWAFLSSGTWSLLGYELRSPILSHDAMRAGFSNEAGVDGTTRFLKNIMGLWLVQECRRVMGGTYSYAELTQLAADAPAGSLIDATDNRFLNPPDMVEEIRQACLDTGQTPPSSPGQIVRCCLESLALAYRRSIRQLETLLGRKIEVLHIIGGGSNNTVLNQWTADACGIPVVSGPAEATALGNILAQMIGAGVLSNWQEARAVSRASSNVYEFAPNSELQADWAKREENIVDLWNH